MRHYTPFYHSSSTFSPHRFTLSHSPLIHSRIIFMCNGDSMTTILHFIPPFCVFVCVLQVISFLNRLFHINQFSTVQSSPVLWKYQICCFRRTVDLFCFNTVQFCNDLWFVSSFGHDLMMGRRQRWMDGWDQCILNEGLLMLNSWRLICFHFSYGTIYINLITISKFKQ